MDNISEGITVSFKISKCSDIPEKACFSKEQLIREILENLHNGYIELTHEYDRYLWSIHDIEVN